MNEIGANPADWDAHFVMVNDVNLADYAGTQFNIIGNSATKFTGAFDGNDRTISSFSYTDPGADYVGLFGYVGEAAQIKNLGIVDVNVLGDTWVGGLVAYNKGTVSNCYAAGSVTGQSYHTGGLAGYNKGTISNCYAIGEVSGENDFTGGLVAFNVGTISNCYVFGSVIANDDVTGGLVGYNSGAISD